MRLLHSTSLQLRDFSNHEGITYAILSHTWAEEEVLFQDIDGFNATTMPAHVMQKPGYKKIEACCAQAERDGFEYVWIDTCCIDKRSSAELSEAINSMYHWYRDCTVCYAYLADVPNNASPAIRDQKFKASRWFTRGWTLQELIAPLDLEFYGDEWHLKGQKASLGTKRSLQALISDITQIPERGLLSSGIQQQNYSIAQIMSWASKRTTTGKEDRAYSMLGLFNVNMPSLYGEGDRAFIRLQEEIMKASTDETIFAWKIDVGNPHSLNVQGLLAISPDYFAESGGITTRTHSVRGIPYTVTNRGLRLEMMLPEASNVPETSTFQSHYTEFDKVYLSVLNCIETQTEKMVGIILARLGQKKEEGKFIRIHSKGLVYISSKNYTPSERDRTSIFARLSEFHGPLNGLRNLQGRHNDLESQHQTVVIRETPDGFQLVKGTPPGLSWKLEDQTWIASYEEEIAPSFPFAGFPTITVL